MIVALKRLSRFSLSLLLLFVLAISVPLAYLSWTCASLRRQAQVARTLEEGGAVISVYDSSVSRPQAELDESIGVACLARMCGRPVIEVHFQYGRVEKNGEMTWKQVPVRREYLTLLHELPDLRVLRLGKVPLTDEELERIAGLPSLEALVVESDRIGDNGVVSVATSQTLVRVAISGAKITSSGMAALGTMRRLRHLQLDSAALADKDLGYLKGNENLEVLRLNDTGISDEAVEHLVELESLQFLDVRRTRVSEAGIGRLKAELPGCLILSDFTEEDSQACLDLRWTPMFGQETGLDKV